MFKNLVESGSHTKDFKRRGTFLAGAVLFYAVVLMVAGVGSIYAYNVRLDEREELEVLALMIFPPQPAAAEPEKRQEAPAPSGESQTRQYVTRPVISVITPYHENREVAPANVREVSPRIPVRIGPDSGDNNVINIGPIGPGVPGVPHGTLKTGPAVVVDPGEGDAPAKTPKADPPPQDPPQVVRVTSSVLVGKTINKPVPIYPVIAKQARIQGTVPVQILIDERGQVVSAQATGGPVMLQQSAVEAARRARFTPTILTGRAVKVSGVILYNFVLN